MSPWQAQILYALAWLSFGAGQSLLATAGAHRRMTDWFGRAYRLVYNGVAAVHLLAVLAVGHGLVGPEAGFALPAWAEAALAALALIGGVLFLVSLRYYDTGLLTGLRQWREGPRGDESEPLTLTGPHRLVRHPLYATGFLILWGRAVDPLGLATAVWVSLYLVIGAAFEERKLLRRHGAAYAAYRRRVPAFVPWRGIMPPPTP